MNNSNLDVKPNCSKVIVVGVQELEAQTVTIKIANPDEDSQNLTLKRSELHQIINH